MTLKHLKSLQREQKEFEGMQSPHSNSNAYANVPFGGEEMRQPTGIGGSGSGDSGCSRGDNSADMGRAEERYPTKASAKPPVQYVRY